MPRELEKLPRSGYCSYLNTPRWDGKPKAKWVRHADGGQSKPHNPKLKYKHRSSILRYEVWCTICFDAGCDKCPPFPEGE